MDGLSGNSNVGAAWLGGALLAKFDPIDPHRTRDVLEALLAGVDEVGRNLALHLPPYVLGDRNAARFGDAFDPRRDVDAVAKDVLALDDDIADVDPDPEPDRIDFGATGIVLAKLSLDFDSTSDGVYCACEFHQRAVAHELNDAARIAGDCRIDQLTPQGVKT